MRVHLLCIDDSNQPEGLPFKIEFLETYIPIDDKIIEGVDFYTFAITFPMVWFCKKKFIPLSDIDETRRMSAEAMQEAEWYWSHPLNQP